MHKFILKNFLDILETRGKKTVNYGHNAMASFPTANRRKIEFPLQLAGQMPCYQTFDSKTSQLVDYKLGQLVDVNQLFEVFP